MNDSGGRTLAPPYTSFKTLLNFIDGLREDGGVPGVIDSSVMSNLSGAVQTQLKSTLRYLNLIDDANAPKPRLSELVKAEGAERKRILSEILADSYTFLPKDEQGNFDLSAETANTFSAKFRAAGLSGETLDKAERFFLQALKEVGGTIPSRLEAGRPRSESGSKRPPEPSNKPNREPKQTSSKSEKGSKPKPLHPEENQKTWEQTIADRMVGKFPEFNPEWDEESRKAWFEQFGGIMSLLRQSRTDERSTEEDNPE